MSNGIWRIASSCLAGAGVPVAVSTIALGWPTDNPLGFALGPSTLAVMALAGVSILLLAGRLEAAGRQVRAAMTVLGLSTLVYPCLLAMAAAGRGGPAVAFLAGVGHWTPLTMVNLLPILAISAVTRCSRRGWVAVLLLLAVVAVLVPALGEQSLALLGSIAWLGGFLIPILATWPAVRGTGAEVRRRAVLCGLASVIPVVIIGFCMMLGAAERVLRAEDLAVTSLMVGFSVCTAATAGLVWGATQPRPTRLLGRDALLVSLAGILTVATFIVSLGVGLGVLEAASPPAALLAGVLTTAGAGLASVLLHRWAARQVDPRAELESELATLGDVTGHRRVALQQVLRKVAADPGLQLAVRASDGVWVGPDGHRLDPPAEGVALAGAGGAVRVLCTTSQARRRLVRLGDCSRLLAPAVLETSVEREAARADGAARAERRRLGRDLHDGVQAHLLGIALNLQLSGQLLADPQAHLLVDETVTALRDVVREVRSLGAGSTPAVLVDDGLAAALTQLVHPLEAVSQLRVPRRRLPSEVERTAYFVACEAIANAVKHARAETIQVVVEDTRDLLTVMVSDDGVGGADLRLGTGLRGITERVAASGGLLTVRDGSPRGTVVEASLPCG